MLCCMLLPKSVVVLYYDTLCYYRLHTGVLLKDLFTLWRWRFRLWQTAPAVWQWRCWYLSPAAARGETLQEIRRSCGFSLQRTYISHWLCRTWKTRPFLQWSKMIFAFLQRSLRSNISGSEKSGKSAKYMFIRPNATYSLMPRSSLMMMER